MNFVSVFCYKSLRYVNLIDRGSCPFCSFLSQESMVYCCFEAISRLFRWIWYFKPTNQSNCALLTSIPPINLVPSCPFAVLCLHIYARGSETLQISRITSRCCQIWMVRFLSTCVQIASRIRTSRFSIPRELKSGDRQIISMEQNYNFSRHVSSSHLKIHHIWQIEKWCCQQYCDFSRPTSKFLPRTFHTSQIISRRRQ